MISMRRFNVDPNQIAGIVLSHLHGDHFGGLPFFVLDAQLVSRRTAPLIVAGPPGLQERLNALMEACFPGSTRAQRKFAIEIIEMDLRAQTTIGSLKLSVTPTPVRHPSGSPSTALRIECDQLTIAYTGDTEWVDDLIDVGRAADILIAEAYTFEKRIPYHLDFQSFRRNAEKIGAKRTILTHMSPDMLGQSDELLVGYERAYDGMRLDL